MRSRMLILITFLLRPAYAPSATPWGSWLIPMTSFNSWTDFETYWNYNYPWGTDHNGGARMRSSQVSVQNGQLTLTSHRVFGQPPTGGGTAIHYLSGTVWAKQPIAVEVNGGYDISGRFLAPTERGTWPAIWLTGQNSWPPEIDLAEWKGNGNVSFNCVDINYNWLSDRVAYPRAGRFHGILVKLRDYNGVDIEISFYLDNVLQTTQIGKQMVGAPFWLIIDYQMEGSSGSPGPALDTHYAVKEFSVHSVNDAYQAVPARLTG